MTTAGARSWPTLRLSSSPSAGSTPFKVLLDGQLVSLPLGLNSQLMVFCSGQRAVVETAAGITLTFDWHSTVYVKLPSHYQGAVCGLCGNYNAMPQDDLTMRDSHPAPDATWLGEIWQVALVPGCSSGFQGTQCQSCSDTENNAYSSPCGIIADKAGPFKECHGNVDPAPYLEDCFRCLL